MFRSRRSARRYSWSLNLPLRTNPRRRSFRFSVTKKQVGDEKPDSCIVVVLDVGGSVCSGGRKIFAASAGRRQRHADAGRIQQTGRTGREAAEEDRCCAASLLDQTRRG